MKKGFTLIELLAVIVILGIISVIGVSVIYSYIQNTNKKTFTIEANNVISAAKKAVDLYEINSIKLPAGQVSDGKDVVPSRYCLTLSDLVEKGLWKKDASEVSENGDYEGKIVIVRPAKSKSYTYTLTMHDKNWKINGSTSEVKEDNITKYDSENDDGKYTCGVNLSSLNLSYIKGLYRFQGTNSEVNNYICFGTKDKDTCTGTPARYLYRIMGFDSNGSLKLKKWDSIGAQQWNTANGYEWNNASLYSGLNGDLFLNNTTYVPSPDANGVDWKSKIIATDWHYITTDNINMSASEMADLELEVGVAEENQHIVHNYIGLMYIHDFYYGLAGEGGEDGGYNCSSASTCSSSWIYLGNNGSITEKRSSLEWTITRRTTYHVWFVYGSTGAMSSNNMNLSNFVGVRPVFFLSPSEMIESGTGTITDPYILG